MTSSHYTFGDNELAARRLELLAATYEPSSRALIERLRPEPCHTAIDLGSGLGITTDLLRTASGATRVIGVERSAAYVAEARRRHPDLEFIAHDVTVSPFPINVADLVYCRFLLTHLHAPEAALRAWFELLRPSGRLVLEEVAELSSELPALRRYYEIVEDMQRHYAQKLYIGKELKALCAGLPCANVHATELALKLETATMAQLHGMNLRTWRADPYIVATYDSAELAALAQQIEHLANSGEPQPPVHCVMAQVAVERRE